MNDTVTVRSKQSQKFESLSRNRGMFWLLLWELQRFLKFFYLANDQFLKKFPEISKNYIEDISVPSSTVVVAT